MSRDSRLTDNSPTTSDFDAICESFVIALQTGQLSAGDASTYEFEHWLERVDPVHRSRLAHHLAAIHQRHLQSLSETADLLSTNLDLHFDSFSPKFGDSPSASNAADEVHRAVFNCMTLSRLPDEAKVSLAARIERREYAAGTHLLRQGEPAVGLFLMLSGRVEVVDSSGATRQRIDFDGPGSVLGEMSLLTGQACSADVVAITPVVALVLTLAAFETLRLEYPELEIALSQLVSDRLGQRPHDALCGKLLGGFRLRRCISRGAMGVVYDAIDEATGDQRALKMMRHRFIADTRAHSRFDFEVDLLSRLQHPHIIRTFGHFVAYRTRFLILELCDGSDLKKALIQHGPMPEPIVKAVLGQVAQGLQYAHAQEALHLDLKPANLLVDRAGKVSITDFGLGRLMRSDGCTESIAGTPSYMSPEQFKGTAIGPASDFYALGCLGYELLTGKLLFPEQDLAQMYSRKHYLPNDLWQNPGISESLRVVLFAALEPMVEHRNLELAQMATWARPVPELAEAVFG